MPIISIIIPVFNREGVLCRTLEAIKNQSFTDWECLLVDDSSTDSSWNIIQTFSSRDDRFIALKNRGEKGACGARNTGISCARGLFFQFFDSDDIMHKTLLEDLYNRFSDSDDVVTCWTNVVNTETGLIINTFEHITEGNIHNALLSGKTYVDTNCALIRRDVVNKIGGWSEDCPSYQEWDFHLRLSKIARYTTLHKHLIDYFVGGNDTISKSVPRAVRGSLYILNKNKKDFIKNAPYSYFVNSYSLFGRIQQLRKEGNTNSDDLILLYRRCILPFVRLLVKITYAIRSVFFCFK